MHCFTGSLNYAQTNFFFLMILIATLTTFQSREVPATDTAAVASGLETLTLSLIAEILPASNVVLSVSVRIRLPLSSMRQPLIPIPFFSVRTVLAVSADDFTEIGNNAIGKRDNQIAVGINFSRLYSVAV